MIKLFTILSLLFALFTLVTLPWVSPVLYTTFSILQPQYVWFWAFDGIPLFKLSAGLTLLAWIIQASKGNINYQIYQLPVNKALLMLTFLINLSDWVASYSGGIGSELVLEIFNTTILMYFFCLGLLNNENAIRYIGFAFILATIYYAFDSNLAYFTGDLSSFTGGRLTGPKNGAYNDNNKFAILLVVGFPFLMLGYFHFRSVFIKAFMVIGMGMSLHGIFLTQSRGALLAVGAAVFICTRVMGNKGIKAKLINFVMLAGFVVVVLDQAGGSLSRTKQAANQETVEAVNPRIQSWTVGMKIIKNHPVFGVGVHRFRIASALEFPGESPHVAHNTLITFAANSGIISGLIYLYLFYACYAMQKQIKVHTNKNSLYQYSANSALAALAGFFVGAIFLDLIVFEPFYYLIMLITACYFHVVVLKKNTDITTMDKNNV